MTLGPPSHLRVLFVGVRWPSETFLAQMIDGLLMHDVAIIVATSTKPSPEWLRKRGFDWIPLPPSPGSLAPRRLPSTVKHALRDRGRGWRRSVQVEMLARVPCDVIYFPWNSAAIDYLPLMDMDTPSVVSCRGTQIYVAPHDPGRAGFAEGLARTFARATKVHCVSEAVKSEAEPLGLSADKAVVIPPAVDGTIFHPPPGQRTPSDDLQIVMAGSLNWIKGYEYALVALRRLLAAGHVGRMSIFGDGPERQRLRFTIRDLALDQHVALRDRVDQQQLARALRDADAFLLSSVSEGISNSALEAMSCGLPVVVTDCGGMREAVKDGQEGFVVPVRNPTALSQALGRLAESAELREKMSVAGRDTVHQRFSLDSQVRAFKELLAEAALR